MCIFFSTNKNLRESKMIEFGLFGWILVVFGWMDRREKTESADFNNNEANKMKRVK